MTSRFSQEKDLSEAVRICWLGHSMFLLEDGGHRLVTDPYGEGVGYQLPDVEADIILVSHDHFDHSNTSLIKGDPVVIRDPDPQESAGIRIEGLSTFHDDKDGAERGANVIFRWNMQGIDFAHLGDLGHLPGADVGSGLEGVDVLFIPVGGIFTIDDAQAAQVVKALSPSIAIPMHFKTSACALPIKTADPFTAHFSDVEITGKEPIYLSRQDLPDQTLILVMDYLA
jgi:L-ascorbate metabolism protein UlaG (beta-lactamase superfamily)